MAVRVLDDPVHHVEPLVFVAKQLAEELQDQVRARGLMTPARRRGRDRPR